MTLHVLKMDEPTIDSFGGHGRFDSVLIEMNPDPASRRKTAGQSFHWNVPHRWSNSAREGKSISYAQYLSDHDGKSRPDRVITIPAAEYSRADGGEFRRLEAYKGHPGTSLLRGEGRWNGRFM